MSGSTFGKIFRITTWGESHGKGIGVVIDGCPAGLPLDAAQVQAYLDRRKPGQSRYTTRRAEGDLVEIQSGVFEGKTTGTPISMTVFNTDQRSRDYSQIAECYRPGHADFGYDRKYGFRDYRGGGRSSGRETIGRVAAGAVASLLLQELGITVSAYTRSIGPVAIRHFDPEEIFRNALYMPDAEAARKAAEWLESCMQKKDSSGGVIECVVHGCPAGIGDPVFDKLDACLGQAILSIGAVKGLEIGDGFAAAEASGSENNDWFYPDEEGRITTLTNHAGGILGGISSGNDIVLRAAFKPTPSIASRQKTVTREGKPVEIEIHGRHDPVIVPRAVVVVEAMTALTVADALLAGMSARLDNVKKIWKKEDIR
jgi:chorismate synthase